MSDSESDVFSDDSLADIGYGGDLGNDTYVDRQDEVIASDTKATTGEDNNEQNISKKVEADIKALFKNLKIFHANKIIEDADEGVTLGKGGFGTVYTAKHEDQSVAVKLVKFKDYKDFKTQLAEATLLSHFKNCDQIIDLLGIIEKESESFDQQFKIVMENGGENLESFVRKDAINVFNSKEESAHTYQRRVDARFAINILLQLGNALKFMHKEYVAHRDIKPENILIGSDKNGNITAKICDLGISQRLFKDKNADKDNPNNYRLARKIRGQDNWKVLQIKGTPRFMCPEDLNFTNKDEKEKLREIKDLTQFPGFKGDLFSSANVLVFILFTAIYDKVDKQDRKTWKIVRSGLNLYDTPLFLDTKDTVMPNWRDHLHDRQMRPNIAEMETNKQIRILLHNLYNPEDNERHSAEKLVAELTRIQGKREILEETDKHLADLYDKKKLNQSSILVKTNAWTEWSNIDHKASWFGKKKRRIKKFFKDLTWWQWLLIIIGIILLFGSIAIIVTARYAANCDDNEYRPSKWGFNNCKANECTCDNADAATDKCFTNGDYKCDESCKYNEGLPDNYIFQNLHFENNTNSCIPNICTCNNGNPVPNELCENNNQQRCQTCGEGYILTRDLTCEKLNCEGNEFVGRDINDAGSEVSVCLQNKCTCENGLPAEKENCLENEGEECQRDGCDYGYHSVQKDGSNKEGNRITFLACEKNVCTCDANVGSQFITYEQRVDQDKCWQHSEISCKENVCDFNSVPEILENARYDELKCVKCQDYQHKNTDKGITNYLEHFCEDNSCICTNGVAVADVECFNDQQEKCKECDEGYELTSLNVCVSKNLVSQPEINSTPITFSPPDNPNCILELVPNTNPLEFACKQSRRKRSESENGDEGEEGDEEDENMLPTESFKEFYRSKVPTNPRFYRQNWTSPLPENNYVYDLGLGDLSKNEIFRIGYEPASSSGEFKKDTNDTTFRECKPVMDRLEADCDEVCGNRNLFEIKMLFSSYCNCDKERPDYKMMDLENFLKSKRYTNLARMNDYYQNFEDTICSLSSFYDLMKKKSNSNEKVAQHIKDNKKNVCQSFPIKIKSHELLGKENMAKSQFRLWKIQAPTIDHRLKVTITYMDLKNYRFRSTNNIFYCSNYLLFDGFGEKDRTYLVENEDYLLKPDGIVDTVCGSTRPFNEKNYEFTGDHFKVGC